MHPAGCVFFCLYWELLIIKGEAGMAWYYYLAAGLLLISIAAAAGMFLPLRIFVFYLRENKEDRAALTVKIYRFGLKLKVLRNGETEVTLFLTLGKREFRLPVFRRVVPGRDSIAVRMSRFEYGIPFPRGLFSKAGLRIGLKGFQAIRPVLKKITWKRFDLEVIYGLEDPSLVGLTFGGSWAVGGAIIGLLYHLFSFETVPRINIVPRFNDPALRMHWEGELTMPLFRGLKLLLITRKIGGAVNGTSSH
jgi:hypothetical protein